MKSIHFSQVPDMRGRRTMRYTDVVIEDLRSKALDDIHRREMRDWEEDRYWLEDVMATEDERLLCTECDQ